MRYVENPQLVLGEDKIARIQFDPRSRDDIPQLLMGLQHRYLTPSLREQVFAILKTAIPPEVDPSNGRPGMELWKVLVLGSLRLTLNCDYDRVHELANNHKTLRQMLGHGWLDDACQYSLQTIKDNVRLLTPELLDQINQVVVKAGHQALKKSPEDVLKGRCDSFVVETDVHYPTDSTLLFDASRQVIERTAKLCIPLGRTEWRQSAYQVRQLKRRVRAIQKLKRSKSGAGDSQGATRQAHAEYVAQVSVLLDKAQSSMAELRAEPHGAHDELQVIEDFMAHAHRQASQILERVLCEQVIAHEDKVFSVYEPHTEWISKGKAGVPVELGLTVCVMEDQHGFILHPQVMVKQEDVEVAQEMVRAAQARFAPLRACSFDQGLHSPKNQQALRALLDCTILPKRGKLSEEERAYQHTEAFVQGRRRHAAVESAINALEVHGLDVCPDHGLDGFKRYVALAVVSRNLQKLGALLQGRARHALRHADARKRAA
jgi:transposase, IS5 family